MIDAAALTVFQSLVLKIAPLYAVMAIGFVFGRLRPAAAEPFSFLQIYFIVPVVVVSGIAGLDFQPSYLLLPVVSYLACCVISLAALWGGKKLWPDNTANIFAYSCGSANTGYYGIPVALVVFPPDIIGIFMVTIVGYTLFEGSLGYYHVARGHFTARDSFRKLLRLPILYAFIVGVALSALHAHIPDMLKDMLRDFRGSYVVIGALMIGFGLARVQQFRLDWLLIAFVFAFKFLVWPLVTYGLILLDRSVTHQFDPVIHKMLMLLAVMPLPANTIAFALQLNVQPDKASTLVFLSTLFALVYIPLAMVLWGA